MMKKTIYISMALAAVTLAAVGCAKQTVGTEGPDCPMIIQPEVVSTDGALKSNDGGATKATLINDATGLRTQGFGLSIYNEGGTAYKDKVTMEYKNEAWTPVGGTMDWKWPVGQAYTFYAWSPAGLSGTGKALDGKISVSGIGPFEYTIDDSAEGQKDLMLGYYSGISTDGKAPVKFSHALASVQFKTGTMTGLGNITGIELGGVVTSGTCTPTMSGSTTSFAWSNLGTSTTTLSLEGLSVNSTTPGTAIGKSESDFYFLVLPQSAPLTVTLTDNSSKTVTATIATPALTVGHTAVYTINYDGQTASFSVSIENWDNGQSEAVVIGEKTHLPDGALPGVFSVGADKQVHFSKGNLWADVSDADNPIFNFEENQYDLPTMIHDYGNIYHAVQSHIGHFFFSKDESLAASFSDCTDDIENSDVVEDVLFTNEVENTAKSDFKVGKETGKYRALSMAEWSYLISFDEYDNEKRRGKCVQPVTVCGLIDCMVIAPDECLNGYVFDNTKTSYSTDEWTLAEVAGLVCLPPAGQRYGAEEEGAPSIIEHYYPQPGDGMYWASSPDTVWKNAYFLDFQSGYIDIGTYRRHYGRSIRLVTDVK